MTSICQAIPLPRFACGMSLHTLTRIPSLFFLLRSCLSTLTFSPLTLATNEWPCACFAREPVLDGGSRRRHSQSGYSSSGRATGSGCLAWKPRPLRGVPAATEDLGRGAEGAATGVGLTVSGDAFVEADASVVNDCSTASENLDPCSSGIPALRCASAEHSHRTTILDVVGCLILLATQLHRKHCMTLMV